MEKKNEKKKKKKKRKKNQRSDMMPWVTLGKKKKKGK